MTSLTDRINAAQRPTADVKLSLDGALSSARDAAMLALTDALSAQKRLPEGADARKVNKAVRDAQKALDEITVQLSDSLITLRFTGVPYKQWSEFVRANPPRKGQKEIANPETIYEYAARRTGQLVENDGTLVELTSEDWDALVNALTDGEFGRIVGAVAEVNAGVGRAGIGFLSRASATTRASAVTSA